MDEVERRALKALRFNWAPTPDDVWRQPTFHVEGLHQDALRVILDSFEEAQHTSDSSPVGVALLGQRGSGKTHLLGSVRAHTQAAGGYFFLVSLLDASAFWRSVAQSVLDGLNRETAEQDSQLRTFLRRLADLVGAPRAVRRAVTGESELTRPILDAFVDLLRKHNRQVGVDCQDTARALVLEAAEKTSDQDVGHEFLCANDELEPGERAAWGMRRARRSAQEIVRDVSRLLALTGPTVIAVDQIDLLINQAAKSLDGETRLEWRAALLLEQIAGGLMSLRETTRRTLSVVACLDESWHLVKTQATDTVQDRFREAVQLRQIGSAELGRELIARRFAAPFADQGFTPPHPTWPVRPSAFAEAVQFTPRELLRTIDTHVRACLRADTVSEMHRLVHTNSAGPAPEAAERPADGELAALDARYAALRAEADPAPALDAATEDTVVPALLEAGLTAWIASRDGSLYGLDPHPGTKPALHGRLRRSLDERTEDEEHWAFRAIGSRHPVAALNRIRNASTAAGLTEGVAKRKLFFLRNEPWSGGARTTEVVETFARAGGQTLPFPESDVAALVALRELIRERGYETLRPWFVARRPTDEITFLVAALSGADAPVGEASVPAPDGPPDPVPPHVPAEVAAADAGGAVVRVLRPAPAAEGERAEGVPRPGFDPGSVTLGVSVHDGQPVDVGLAALRRHAAIFAGSGSGKTVLIRRLVEECALRGVSSIVLDPNNDLARLGDPWPEPPAHWDQAESARAAAYHRGTDVVVWTPRRSAGRPLSFRPLPDLASVADDEDAFAAGVDAAVASLAPRANVDGGTAKARIGNAVLREALTAYAREGGGDLREFVAYLTRLPRRASQLDNAPKIANDIAQLLRATMVSDPLFGGEGEPLDPGELFRPAPGHRARVSVISFVGLPDDGQRQSFVNQLQLALFAWIKQNPAGDRPLGGLFVMDEAQTLAPSGAMTACTQSTLALASQARKYGLGLVFATQAPKGLHNRIPGNAATQLFGLLNSPTQIAAAKEMARAKGSDIPDVARLRPGHFYAAVDGAEFGKLRAPLCLSHHPSSPLTAEEVLDRARRD
ncbi:ATP-binding protein [Asanoa iriomotensis]|uniref:ATPase n=1 Tax=Asanoa iriomotensis TaxID=234613 RepID=A0ABQ4C8Y6_9ACTN|nr:ATP-binding protein [Asanoa iriomotensis]GIF59254.1 ATPase [Asanoa iriomotensis]